MDFIEVRLKGCRVYLTADEINTMLQAHTDIFKQGISRGKAFTRANTLRERINAKKGYSEPL